MSDYGTTLNDQEIQWILEGRFTRLTDDKEILIYPMGAERYLYSVLNNPQNSRYNILAAIEDKDLLIIPGHGNSAFLFAEAGAKSVTVYDKDPVTIAWIKGFKKYYHYKEHAYPSIGELLAALTSWYPPLKSLPSGKIGHAFLWAINPKALRRAYLFYMISLVQQAIRLLDQQDFELKKEIRFYTGEINQVAENKEKLVFDIVFVPYLLGVQNGIEQEKAIVEFIQQALQLAPKGHVLVTPAQNTKEFYVTGQRYFVTTKYSKIHMIPELLPYFQEEDPNWFNTQGLAVFNNQEL